MEDLWHVFNGSVNTEPLRTLDMAVNVYEAFLLAADDSTSHDQIEAMQSRMNCFLNILVSRMKADESPLHFELLDRLVDCWARLSPHSNRLRGEHQLISDSSTWIKDLRTVIGNILQSRYTGDQARRTALSLAAVLTDAFGLPWFNSNVQLLQLVANLASIDIRLLLDDETSRVGEFNIDPLYNARCCQFLETVLRHCAACAEETTSSNGPSMTESQVLQVNGSLLELTDFTLQFFSTMHERQKQVPHNISFPLYRLVCAYMAEGLALVKKENLMAAVEPLLALNSSTMSRPDDEAQDFDTVALLLPALSELIDEERAEWNCVKKAFLDHGLLRLLERYVNKSDEDRNVYSDLLQRWKDFSEE